MTSKPILFAVLHTCGGYAREDAGHAEICGLFTDETVAKKVAMVCSGRVVPVLLNDIKPGYAQTLEALSVKLDTSSLDQTLTITPVSA